jgi:hypothetical protein
MLLFLAIACSASHPTSTSPCDLLTRDQVAHVVGAKTEAGTRVPAIVPPTAAREWLCNYLVAAPIRTVVVYLGRGGSPSGSGIDREGATEARGNVYVSITAQYPDKSFGPIARRLAQIAIIRAVGSNPAGGQA